MLTLTFCLLSAAFTEHMKFLGYPRLISLDNFRVPNFELVADCLYWLLQRFYPECNISDDISTEAQRVNFLKSVAQIMLTKARVKLNIKKLYSADGVAVKELLKLASLLYKATQTATLNDEDSADVSDITSSLKQLDARSMKACAAEIVRAGAALHDALGSEAQLRDARSRALAGTLEGEYVERSIGEAIAGVDDALRSLAAQVQELSSVESGLESKLEKRRQELERAEKRLATLAAVRPAYMDEYEQLQGQLQVLYVHYLERFRNLEYLESKLEGYHRTEQEHMNAAERRLKKMQKRLADEEMRILRGEQEVDETKIAATLSDSSDDDDDGDDGESDVDGGDDQQRGLGTSRGPVAGLRQRSFRNASKDVNGIKARQHQQPLAAGQVVGSLGGNWDDDDDASIDEDTATDGGEISMNGSSNNAGGDEEEDGGVFNHFGGVGGHMDPNDFNAGDMQDDFAGDDDEPPGGMESEDSGF
eukprot:jgi/Chrzof1/12510/Cz06g36260.t1